MARGHLCGELRPGAVAVIEARDRARTKAVRWKFRRKSTDLRDI